MVLFLIMPPDGTALFELRLLTRNASERLRDSHESMFVLLSRLYAGIFPGKLSCGK